MVSHTPSKTSISQAAKKWLNRFSDQVDFHRFQRGIMLFNKNHILEMDITPIGFTSEIKGSQSNHYQIQGEFILEGYFPDISTLKINCSCPDDVPFCKHGICAICYVITYFEKQWKSEQTGFILDLGKSEAFLDSFRNYINKNKEDVLSLPSETFWPFESSFNDAMKDIDYVLSTILNELKKKHQG